jgi:hypothetical protein
VQQFYPNDSKWDLLKKILLNQVDNAATSATSFSGLSGQVTQVFDRLYQLNQTVAPSYSFNSLADIVVLVAGTAVRGADHPTPNGVLVVARMGNTGSCYVGGPGVTNASGTQRGIELTQAGMPSTILRIANTNLMWVNADNANDAVGVIIL